MTALPVLKYERIDKACAFYTAQPNRIFGSTELSGQTIAQHLALLQAYCTEAKISVKELTCQYSMDEGTMRSRLVFDVRTALEYEDADHHSICFGLKCLTKLQTPDSLMFRFAASAG